MRTVAIILGDNDFGSTFRPLLETIKRVVEWHGNLTEDQLRIIIKGNMMAHYLSFQHRWDLNEALNPPDFDHTEKYFNKNVRILFDTEAEQHIATHDHDGGSWYLELLSGTVASY